MSQVERNGAAGEIRWWGKHGEKRGTLVPQALRKFSKQSGFNLALPLCSFFTKVYRHLAGKCRERGAVKRRVGHARGDETNRVNETKKNNEFKGRRWLPSRWNEDRLQVVEGERVTRAFTAEESVKIATRLRSERNKWFNFMYLLQHGAWLLRLRD